MRGGWRAVVLWECSCPEGFCCGGARGGRFGSGRTGSRDGVVWRAACCEAEQAGKQRSDAASSCRAAGREAVSAAASVGGGRHTHALRNRWRQWPTTCSSSSVVRQQQRSRVHISRGGEWRFARCGGRGGGGIKGRLGSSFGMLCCQECGAHCARVPCVCGVLRCVAVCLSCTDKSSARQFQRLGAEETVRHQLVCARPAVCSPVHADLCGTDFHGCPTFASSFCIFACAGLSCYGVVCHCTCVFQCLRGAGRSGM